MYKNTLCSENLITNIILRQNIFTIVIGQYLKRLKKQSKETYIITTFTLNLIHKNISVI